MQLDNNNQANIDLAFNELVKLKVDKINTTQVKLAKLFKTQQSEISQALKGYRPELLKKINSYCDKRLKSKGTPQNEA